MAGIKNSVIGIDVGGTKVSAGLFLLDGSIVKKSYRKLEGRSGKEVQLIISALVGELIIKGHQHSLKVRAVGVCVPGISNKESNLIWAPNIPGWENYNLHQELTQLLNDPTIRITIDSDRSCSVLAEMWNGKAKNCENVIFIAVGTGIGAGIVANGTLITGKSGIAGAIGWLGMETQYQKKYDPCGNFEYYASGNGLARSAIEFLKENPSIKSCLRDIPENKLSAEDIFSAYSNDDEIALITLDKAITFWGISIANLISIFNPEKIILGGGVFGPAKKFISAIYKEAKKWAQPISIDQVSIESSSLKGNAGLIGAGYLAIKSLKNQL